MHPLRSLFRMRRMAGSVQEPTLLAIGLTAAGWILLLAMLVGVVFASASIGVHWGVIGIVAVMLIAFVAGAGWRRPRPDAPVTGRQRWSRRFLGWGRTVFALGLAGWLGLIAWSRYSPGGTIPGPKSAPDSLRILNWNILRGQDEGPPWLQNRWPERKHALRAAIDELQPDLLLVQEAKLGQLAYVDKSLSGHRRVGVGRDDGKAGGEHCAIYIRVDRFECLGDGTFWLEEPTDRPGGPGLHVKRICTWVRLRDRMNDRTMRVYNTHQYLTEGAQLPASSIILEHIRAGDASDAIVLAGDFNAIPQAPSRLRFAEGGLRESAALAGRCAEGTFQFYGLRLRCLDGILVGPGWRVDRYSVVSAKPGGVFPSDHFGVLADLALER